MKLKKGKYTVNVTYGGNENYTGNNTTQNLKIKEKAADIKACRLIISIELTTDSDEFCEISVLDIQSLGDVLVDDLAVVAVNAQSNSLVSLGSFF